MVAVATGTAMFLSALPPPGVPIITAGNLKTDSQKVLQYQKVVQDAYDRNRQHYDLKSVPLSVSLLFNDLRWLYCQHFLCSN